MADLFANCSEANEDLYFESGTWGPTGTGIWITDPHSDSPTDSIRSEPSLTLGGFPSPPSPTIGCPNIPVRYFSLNTKEYTSDSITLNPWVIPNLPGIKTKKIICSVGGMAPESKIFMAYSAGVNSDLINHWNSPLDAPFFSFSTDINTPPKITIPVLPHDPNDLIFYGSVIPLWGQSKIKGIFDIRYIYQEEDGSYNINDPELARLRVSLSADFNIVVGESKAEPTWDINYGDSVAALSYAYEGTSINGDWSINNGTIQETSLRFMNDSGILHNVNLDIDTKTGQIKIGPIPDGTPIRRINNLDALFLRLNLTVLDSTGRTYSILDPIDFDVALDNTQYSTQGGGSWEDPDRDEIIPNTVCYAKYNIRVRTRVQTMGPLVPDALKVWYDVALDCTCCDAGDWECATQPPPYAPPTALPMTDGSIEDYVTKIFVLDCLHCPDPDDCPCVCTAPFKGCEKRVLPYPIIDQGEIVPIGGLGEGICYMKQEGRPQTFLMAFLTLEKFQGIVEGATRDAYNDARGCMTCR